MGCDSSASMRNPLKEAQLPALVSPIINGTLASPDSRRRLRALGSLSSSQSQLALRGEHLGRRHVYRRLERPEELVGLVRELRRGPSTSVVTEQKLNISRNAACYAVAG